MLTINRNRIAVFFIINPLYEPEAFHTENYTKSPNNVGVSFILKVPHEKVPQKWI